MVLRAVSVYNCTEMMSLHAPSPGVRVVFGELLSLKLSRYIYKPEGSRGLLGGLEGFGSKRLSNKKATRAYVPCYGSSFFFSNC